MAKSNQKCVRLSDRAVEVVERYRGDNFSDKLENLLVDFEYRRDQMAEDWNRLQAQVNDKHAEMVKIQEKVRRMRNVDVRFGQLVEALLDLMKIQ